MPALEQVLVDAWRQSLVDGAKSVEIDGKKYPAKMTTKRRLKQVDFRFDGHDLRGLEQNPDTKSRWAKCRVKERGSRNSSMAVGTSQLWWTVRQKHMADRAERKTSISRNRGKWLLGRE